MTPGVRTLARILGGTTIMAIVIWRLGATAMLDGLRSVSVVSLLAATGITIVTTVCAAWRWSLVARGIGVEITMRNAVPAYYRSQFLNTVLPGGVLGDVHRGMHHGRGLGDVGRGLRAVAWERIAGQLVQMTLALFVLLTFPSPVRSPMLVIAPLVVVGGLGAVFVIRALPRQGPSRRARTLRAAHSDVRDGLMARTTWPSIVIASAAIVAGHTVTFLVAARTAGSTASVARILPLAILVLLAMTLPMNVGGWGPREGAAAWLFGAAGLGAGLGLATATVFGVMTFAASLPGAAVVLVQWLGRNTAGTDSWPLSVAAQPEGAVSG